MADAKSVIALSDEQWDQYAAQSDRAKPSPYQADVDAARVGDKFAVPLPVGEDGPEGDRTIVANLHKAARVAGKNIQVMVRKNANPPAVLWTIREGGYVKPERKPRAPKSETVAADETDQETPAP